MLLWLLGLIHFALAISMSWDFYGADLWWEYHMGDDVCKCGDCRSQYWPGPATPEWAYHSLGLALDGLPNSWVTEWSVLLAFGILGTTFVMLAMFRGRWLQAWRRRRERRWTHCECGYDLRGLPGERCPECGKPIVSHS